MKKVLILAAMCFFTAITFAQTFNFSAGKVKEVEIVINEGILSVTAGDVKEITIDIASKKNVKRNIYLNHEKELKVFLTDSDIKSDTLINIVIPKKMELDIDSRQAAVNVFNMTGSLSVDAKVGKITIDNFNGKLDINTVSAQVNASGVFKEIDIENGNGEVNLTLQKVPMFYEYEVEGTGKIIFNTPKKSEKLKIDSKKFYGTLEIN